MRNAIVRVGTCLFGADEQTLQIIEGLVGQEPVPLDELPLDPND